MTATLTAPAVTGAQAEAPFRLEVHICDERRSYEVEFVTEDQVLDFIARKTQDAEAWRAETGAAFWQGGHAYHELEGDPIPEGWDRLYALLYPTCEHGLSADLCAGYGHYPMDHPAYM